MSQRTSGGYGQAYYYICTELKIFVEISNGTFSRETLKPGCHNHEKIITGCHAGLLSKTFLEQYVAN